MQPLSLAEIRSRYLKFFEQRGHKIYPSDSLVPANDPTLLFTGAGMNQFKDMFLGKGTLPWRRLTTSQKCLRVPDLDNVGVTARHHTFFEMLGNFSFGDYFKKECIAWEWEFFRDSLGIPDRQMVVTIFSDDEEAFDIWTKVVGLAPNKIFRFGEKENFWPAEAPSKGPNGPCGPCSEIYFDAFPDLPLPNHKGLLSLPDDRFTEIGNCVFTQYERKSDGSLVPLPQKNIDVGLGLERIAAVLQGAKNNFETELFRPFLDHLAHISGTAYGVDPKRDVRMRRIADHVRAITFCIADGALPSNEGRGYVVRKILRRAARDGYELGLHEPFLFAMVEIVGKTMGEHYPEVRDNAAQCRAVIKGEEDNFLICYRQGTARLAEFLRAAPTGSAPGRPLESPMQGSGGFAFQLHDTYGFPVDITQKMMEERGYALDMVGFEQAMAEQQKRARASMATAGAVFTASIAVKLRDAGAKPTTFCGYEVTTSTAELTGIVGEGDLMLPRVLAGEKAVMVCAASPFYAQGGGQVGDRGTIVTATGEAQIATTTGLDGFHLHQAVVTLGYLARGQMATLTVDATARRATERNHTATHLLHAALKKVLGAHVSQAGSEVSPERLRFDYTQPEKPSAEQMQRVEEEVNAQILLANPVQAVVRGLAEAKAMGFTALFGEKYGERVRTLRVGDFSLELCGGTHAENTGNIGAFRITTDAAIAAGTRRIEAVTGIAQLQMAWEERQLLANLSATLKVPGTRIVARVVELSEELKKVRKELEKALAPDLAKELANLSALVVEHQGVRTVIFERPGLTTKDAQDLVRLAHQSLDPLVVVIFSAMDGEVAVVVGVAKTLLGKIKAGDLLKAVTALLGGGGGGKPEMAQGKGKDVTQLANATMAAIALLRESGLRG
jgi:alanyl-tRNA synthetase